MNLSDKPIESLAVQLPTTGKWKLVFNSVWEGYSEDFSVSSFELFIECRSVDDPVSIDISAYCVQIFTLS